MQPTSDPISLEITRIDARKGGKLAELETLRAKLSPDGNVVSERGKQLTLRVFGKALSPVEVVQTICDQVRREGTPALLRYSQALDGHPSDASGFRVPLEKLKQAHSEASAEFLAAIRRISGNIRGFQEAILHRDVQYLPSTGVMLRQRYVPLRRVGVCVPGGAAAYPSTVLMTVVPAQAAGVKEIAVIAPPTPFGAFNRDFLATCYELGIEEVYAVGGAQGVAALAYGTDCIPEVDKIVGPGSLFVALAKRHVYGHVDIDSIAGPSEVVVIADRTCRPDFIAADILAQAEHSPGSSIVISWDETLLDEVSKHLIEQVRKLERSELTLDSLRSFGAMILVRDWKQACELTDELAPEHLHIETSNAHEMCEAIHNAGATFIGNYSPVALGDYAAGPSHVLPTGGTARWAAGLTANSFLRGGSVIEYSAEALHDIASEIALLAECEGLTAHKRSVTIRVPDTNKN